MTRPGWRASLLPWLALGGWACTIFGVDFPPPPCSSDSDCNAGAICFPEGCGDPGKGIKVQVTHGGAAREYSIDQVSATYDQLVASPQTLSGYVSQTTDGGSVTFNGSVTLRASGNALLLPGVPRIKEPSLMPSFGQYQMLLDTGAYTSLVAIPADRNIPPQYLQPRQVKPGDKITANIAFPLSTSLLRITGKLLISIPAGPVNAAMEVQVLDDIGRPLTQRQPVDPLGDFVVLAPPAATLSGQLRLLATPKDGVQPVGQIIPNQIFSVPAPTGPLVLEMGAFGTAVTVSGTAVGADGTPVAGASVYIAGTVEGGGTFRSASVLTGSGGEFTLLSLPSPSSAAPLTLWVVPPVTSNSGILQHPLVVGVGGAVALSLSCPARVPVHGRVLRPDGVSPATGVDVHAEVIAAIDGLPVPPGGVVAMTDGMGEFTLLVDPATYRLDFLPADQLPRVSRWLDVRAVLQPGAGPAQVEVPEFTLWNGRTLEGTITGFATANATSATPLGAASVEFYRVVDEGGSQRSYRLATGTTDGLGRYQVIMPTAPDAGSP